MFHCMTSTHSECGISHWTCLKISCIYTFIYLMSRAWKHFHLTRKCSKCLILNVTFSLNRKSLYTLYLWNFIRKVPGMSLETLPGQYRSLKFICDKQGEDYSTCRGPRARIFKYIEPSFPPFPIIKSHKSIIFSGTVFLSSSLREVIFGGPETLKLVLRNKLPSTSDDFRMHCFSSSGATLHLCIHPSYLSFNSRWYNPGM